MLGKLLFVFFLSFGERLVRCPSLRHCRRATRFPPLIYNVFVCVCKAAAEISSARVSSAIMVAEQG